MTLARLALWIGVALVVLGVGFWLGTGRASVTALIPAFLGAAIALLAGLALAMGAPGLVHVAGAVAAMGLVVGGWRLYAAVSAGGRATVLTELALMVVLCLVLVVQWVRSLSA